MLQNFAFDEDILINDIWQIKWSQVRRWLSRELSKAPLFSTTKACCQSNIIVKEKTGMEKNTFQYEMNI